MGELVVGSKRVKERPIKKLLIANRGEIALRIIRSARDVGIKTVAVYSEADAAMAHVGAADEAHLIGPPEASQSYLNIGAITEAAVAAGAEAGRPRFRLPSGRPQFARAGNPTRGGFVGAPGSGTGGVGGKCVGRPPRPRGGGGGGPGG